MMDLLFYVSIVAAPLLLSRWATRRYSWECVRSHDFIRMLGADDKQCRQAELDIWNERRKP